jgi:hypothetical protein
MKIPKDFKVSAGVGGLGGNIPEPVQKILPVLDTLPFKLLLNSREVAQRSGICLSGIHSHAPHYLADYRVKVGIQFLYGSKKTIAELLKRQKEQTSAEEN